MSEETMPEQSFRADAWVATSLGEPTKVLERQTIEVPPPAVGEVLVNVRAFCVNFNDGDIVRGRWATVPLKPPFVPGMEAMGEVELAGPGAEHLLGHRIVGIATGAHGGCASLANVDSISAMKIPSWLTDAQGAAMHFPFHLGWFGLVNRARLEPCETVLVHAGAGGVGSAVIQIAKALGAVVKWHFVVSSVPTLLSTIPKAALRMPLTTLQLEWVLILHLIRSGALLPKRRFGAWA